MNATLRTDPLAPDLVDEWHALWERDPGACVFQHPAYLGAWFPDFAGAERAVIVEARDEDRLVALANLGIDAAGVLRFLGDPDVTDYFGPVSEEPQRARAAEMVMTAVRALDGWTRAELLGLREDSVWLEPLSAAARAAGFQVTSRRQDVCPRIELGGDYDAYLASLDAKLRHELKRKARKLERDAGPYTIRLATGDTLHADLEHFFELHRTSSGEKGHFLHWGMAGFFTLLARAFDRLGWLRLTLLEVEGVPWAAVLSFNVRGVWSVYNSGYDHRMRDLAPGMVLMGETIRLATEERCHTFDLLRGDEPYKYRFGARDIPLFALEFERA